MEKQIKIDVTVTDLNAKGDPAKTDKRFSLGYKLTDAEYYHIFRKPELPYNINELDEAMYMKLKWDHRDAMLKWQQAVEALSGNLAFMICEHL